MLSVNPLEKGKKNHQKHFYLTTLLITFFGCVFLRFFQLIWNQHKIQLFMELLFIFFKNNFVLVLLGTNRKFARFGAKYWKIKFLNQVFLQFILNLSQVEEYWNVKIATPFWTGLIKDSFGCKFYNFQN